MPLRQLIPLGIVLSGLGFVGAAYAQEKAVGAAPAKAKAAAPAKPAKPGKAAPRGKAARPSPEVPRTESTTQAPADASPPSSAAAPVKEAEGPEGVKTYEFQAIEVEGRLKSPQLIYFLRRVRAEFRAGALGHRSFLGELSDTRREAAFR